MTSGTLRLKGKIAATVIGAAAAMALFSCSVDDGGPEEQATSSDAGPGAPAPDAPSSDAAPTKDAAAVPGLKIVIDYRFDTRGWFADAKRRAAMEAAAAVWGTYLHDRFAVVPKGTYAITRNPEAPDTAAQPVTLEADIEGLLVFVGAATFAGSEYARSSSTAGLSQVSDPQLLDALRERYEGDDHEPWTGWISFSDDTPFYFDDAPTPNGSIPPSEVDFVSVALHELAHVLGFGPSKRFGALAQGGSFNGARAVALYGGPVPLAADGKHMPNRLEFQGIRVLMDEASRAGERSFPTALDLAMLEDIGYEP